MWTIEMWMEGKWQRDGAFDTRKDAVKAMKERAYTYCVRYRLINPDGKVTLHAGVNIA